jgi:threonine/homoserine/homoserine lactone efflux protein
MDPFLLLRAVALGFAIAAGVGPISLLTIRRTLAHGRVYGLASGMGVATADATYAAIAAFGLTAVTSVLVGARVAFGILGGLLLAWVGLRTMRSRPPERGVDGDGDRPGLVAAYLSIYGLTMTNPMTIVSFIGLFGALGLAGAGLSEAATLTLGVFVGSALWWLVLTTVVGLLRSRVTPWALLWVNRISGLVIAGFGAAAIVLTVASVFPAR